MRALALAIFMVLTAGSVRADDAANRAAVDAELAHHKERRARLLDLHAKAVAQERPELVDRIAKIKEKENRRHLKALARIKREQDKAAKRDTKPVKSVKKAPRGEAR